jgi:hypothetical protein
MLAMCNLIVAKQIVRHFRLTRLMVGHTHFDMDGLFGIIWKKIWRMHLKSPQQFMQAFYSALENLDVKVTIMPIFAIPDYEAFLKPSMCPVERAFKEEWTQLQFNFDAYDFCPSCMGPEKCSECSNYPSGVKVS